MRENDATAEAIDRLTAKLGQMPIGLVENELKKVVQELKMIRYVLLVVVFLLVVLAIRR